MMTKEATPRPWRRSGDRIIQTKHITRDVWEIPRVEADLDLIVEAVNAYDTLRAESAANLARAERAEGLCRSALAIANDYLTADRTVDETNWRAFRDQLRAALAPAQR